MSDEDFVDYDDGFDGGDVTEESSGGDALLTAEAQNDAIAALLQGDDSKYQEIAGKNPKPSREISARNVDADGRMTSSRDSAPPQQQPPAQGHYAVQINAQRNAAAKQYDDAVRENARLTEMYEHGSLTEQEFHQKTYEQGVLAAQAERALFQNKLAEYELEKQHAAAHDALQQSIGEDWAPERRQETMRNIVNFCVEKGIPVEMLQGVDQPFEALFLYQAYKDSQDATSLRQENGRLKQRLREAKRAAGQVQKRAAKSNNMGHRHGTEAQLDQIVDLLTGGGK